MTADIYVRARRCLTGAISEVNLLRPPEAQLSTEDDEVILGEHGKLDSLGVVNLAVALEQAVEGEFGTTIGVVDELLGGHQEEGLSTVSSVIDFVARKASESA